MGMAFIVIGSVLAAYNYYGTNIILISNGIIGLGIGLLFPVAFWRHITQMSAGGKVTLVVAGVAGAAAGWFVSDAVTFVMGRSAIWALAAPVALLVGLSSVLASSIVRISRRV